MQNDSDNDIEPISECRAAQIELSAVDSIDKTTVSLSWGCLRCAGRMAKSRLAK